MFATASLLGISPLSFLALYRMDLALAIPESVRSILLSKLNTGMKVKKISATDLGGRES
jgi:hypothetical protein